MKSCLVSKRRVFSAYGFLPECAYCGRVIRGGPDMHEHFFTRGDIRSNWELLPLIMTDYNCSLVHPGKCHIQAATKEGQRRVIKHVLKWEGNDQVLHWLLALAALFRSPAVIEAIGLYTSVVEELNAEKESKDQDVSTPSGSSDREAGGSASNGDGLANQRVSAP
ncbi:MAG: hypothetical protein LUO89_11295 [Methanothrix sp.]|nr:hypothetical protein [Methanothrix sp.]